MARERAFCLERELSVAHELPRQRIYDGRERHAELLRGLLGVVAQLLGQLDGQCRINTKILLSVLVVVKLLAISEQKNRPLAEHILTRVVVIQAPKFQFVGESFLQRVNRQMPSHRGIWTRIDNNMLCSTSRSPWNRASSVQHAPVVDYESLSGPEGDLER